MLKRLSFAALIALTTIMANPQNQADAVLPHAHTGLPTSLKCTLSSEALSAERIASSAQRQAAMMGSVGFCYRGVKRALAHVGVDLTGNAAWMAREQLSCDSRFCRVPISKLRRGDIIVHDRSKAHPYGHIAVYLGNGAEASDHIQHLVLGGRYGSTVVFRPKSAVHPVDVQLASYRHSNAARRHTRMALASRR